jgi:peptide/nickel transport system ATP-binding protein
MNPDGQGQLLIEVKDLRTHFFLDEGVVRAVDGVDMRIWRGQTLGVVGESGCGKSMTARSILRIVPRPGRIVSGDITLYRLVEPEPAVPAGRVPASSQVEEIKLTQLDPSGRVMRSIRGSEIALVPQEPMASLSPVHTIGNQIAEAIMLHQGVDKRVGRERAIEMLKLAGFPKPNERVDSYPHQLSGGLRQRAVIAMGLSCHPSLLIADEPTTALDVTTEAQILRLMRQLQDQLGMAILYITHNLGVVAKMCTDVVVMYMGRVVEESSVDALFHSPLHPYTQALLRSIPRFGEKKGARQRLQSIRGTVPDPFALPKGCSFHPRCAHAIPGVCDVDPPPWLEVEPGHKVRCVLYGG